MTGVHWSVMAEADRIQQTYDWRLLDTPLLRATVAAFSGYLGNGAHELSFDKFNTYVAQAFPTIEQDRETQLLRLQDRNSPEVIRTSVWGARNVIINHLPDVDPRQVGHMAYRMAELGTNDATGYKLAGQIMDLHDTNQRFKINASLQILSLGVVQRSLGLPPQLRSIHSMR